MSMEPYTQEEADRTVDMGSHVPPHPQQWAVSTEVSPEVPVIDTST